MSMTLEAAAQAFRDAMRDSIKRHSLWYLIEGVLLVVAGILAMIYPLLSSVAVVVMLGWLLIISGILQGVSLLSARNVPHFWLQLIFLRCSWGSSSCACRVQKLHPGDSLQIG